MSSLFNPGKRGILTLLSVVLIIGIPGMIAYADSSSDTYYSAVENLEVTEVGIYTSSSSYIFDAVSVTDGDSTTISLADTASDGTTALSSLTAVTAYRFVFNSTEDFPVNPSKVFFASNIEDVSGTNLYLLSDGSTFSAVMEYDSDAAQYEYELTSVQAAAIGTAYQIKFTQSLSSSAAALSEIEISYSLAEKKTVFTDDVVELIVLVGGIALLVIGTFSLSFIDLDTPGKAANSFIRGAKSAGRKVANYGRKKR